MSVDDHAIQSGQFLKPWNADDIPNIEIDAATYDPDAIEPASDLAAALARLAAHAQYVYKVNFVGGGGANPEDHLTTEDWKRERENARAAMMALASLASPTNRKSVTNSVATSKRPLPTDHS